MYSIQLDGDDKQLLECECTQQILASYTGHHSYNQQQHLD